MSPPHVRSVPHKSSKAIHEPKKPGFDHSGYVVVTEHRDEAMLGLVRSSDEFIQHFTSEVY